MELTRKQVIEELQKMLDYCSIRQDSTPERKQALVYAISSLKTDEAYQLMYEGEEVYTKNDLNIKVQESFQNGYEKGYHRAQLDYGLEDDLVCSDEEPQLLNNIGG